MSYPAPVPQVIRHEIDEGFSGKWIAIAGLVGVISGSIGMCGFITKPQQLEDTRKEFDQQVAKLELRAETFAEDAAVAIDRAEAHRQKAEEAQARVAVLESELARPAALETAPAPLPAIVIERTSPEVQRRLLYFEGVFEDVEIYVGDLEALVGEQKFLVNHWELAHAGVLQASLQLRAAYESEKERADTAQARVDQYERVHFGSKKKLLAIAGVVALVLFASQGEE